MKLRLTHKQKHEALENALRSFNFDSKYFIHRCGHKFAIATKTELGGINTHTSFLTYDGMNEWLRGYHRALNNPLK